jgi:hypothetical protein
MFRFGFDGAAVDVESWVEFPSSRILPSGLEQNKWLITQPRKRLNSVEKRGLPIRFIHGYAGNSTRYDSPTAEYPTSDLPAYD